MQSESAAGAHFSTGIVFRRQIRLLLFISNNARGHQVSVSRDRVRRKYSCGFLTSQWEFTWDFLIRTRFSLPCCDICKQWKLVPQGWSSPETARNYAVIYRCCGNRMVYYIMDTIMRLVFILTHSRLKRCSDSLLRLIRNKLWTRWWSLVQNNEANAEVP